MSPLFVTGTGTGIGKTVVSAILVEALQADYWKPVQAGVDVMTDSQWVRELITNSKTTIHPETYVLKLAASPHIAARADGIDLQIESIQKHFKELNANGRNLVIEGAGGLMVPLNEKEFVSDLIKKLQVNVILVSRNYLGSINHSLLTARECKRQGLNIKGWIFNDQYLDYEEEIVEWTGFPRIGSVPTAAEISKAFISQQAEQLKKTLI
jgi:dethiobiotin synthetase